MGVNKPGYHHAYREDLRQKAFLIMGNQCQECGEKDPVVLCIDHIKAIGHVRRMTISIYFEIIQHPEAAKKKYQLLCRNCNWKKMIENNERAPRERQFALKQEHDALAERVIMLERKVRIREIRTKEEIIIKRETATEIEEDIERLLQPQLLNLINEKGQLSVPKMRIWLREHSITISSWKAYQIKGIIEAAHPQLFNEADAQ